MIPNPDCRQCPLSNVRKCIVPSFGETPADVLVLIDAPSDVDELFGKLVSGPNGKLLTSLLFEAAERACTKFSAHIATIVMCRSQSGGVDRAPNQKEILRCMPNIMEITDAVRPLLTVLVGDTVVKHYQKEFQESVVISPPWLIRKHPGLWLNTVGTIADGLKKYVKG